jgi:hypothetical protein
MATAASVTSMNIVRLHAHSSVWTAHMRQNRGQVVMVAIARNTNLARHATG